MLREEERPVVGDFTAMRDWGSPSFGESPQKIWSVGCETRMREETENSRRGVLQAGRLEGLFHGFRMLNLSN